jgi:lipopolysaccharide assembly outer membrane protein LptD (OstA)
MSNNALVLVGACVIFSCLCQSQEPVERKYLMVPILNASRPVTASAMNVSKEPAYPSLIRLSGKVEVRTPVCLPIEPDQKFICNGETILRADEAVLHQDTGEIEAHGAVRLIPVQRRQ